MTASHSAGSRKVEPRKRKTTPSDQRRRVRRAIAKTLHTRDAIQATAHRRQTERPDGRAVAAASATTELEGLYGEFRIDRRNIYATGVVPEGTQYRGKTAKAGTGG